MTVRSIRDVSLRCAQPLNGPVVPIFFFFSRALEITRYHLEGAVHGLRGPYMAALVHADTTWRETDVWRSTRFVTPGNNTRGDKTDVTTYSRPPRFPV